MVLATRNCSWTPRESYHWIRHRGRRNWQIVVEIHALQLPSATPLDCGPVQSAPDCREEHSAREGIETRLQLRLREASAIRWHSEVRQCDLCLSHYGGVPRAHSRRYCDSPQGSARRGDDCDRRYLLPLTAQETPDRQGSSRSLGNENQAKHDALYAWSILGRRIA